MNEIIQRISRNLNMAYALQYDAKGYDRIWYLGYIEALKLVRNILKEAMKNA